MELLRNLALDELSPCPYLEGREKQFEYFFAHNLDEEEISSLLSEGWRKFGIHFFRPACPTCTECIPLRVLTNDFAPSKSQRRILKKEESIDVKFGPPRYDPRIYQIFEAHSLERFSQPTGFEDFLLSFYTPACPGMQSEYYFEGELVGVGFLDRGSDCLSSVYFAFDPHRSELGLGTFSILKEIEEARKMGLPHYYLGFYVPGCARMTYKDHFLPREHYDWESAQWLPAGE